MSKFVEGSLKAIANISKIAADKSLGDWCWLWTYKPERPAFEEDESMEEEKEL